MDALRGRTGEESSDGVALRRRLRRGVADGQVRGRRGPRVGSTVYDQLATEVQGTPTKHGATGDVAGRLEELRALSHAELFGLAQAGIGRLRRAFGLRPMPEAALLERVVARGGGP